MADAFPRTRVPGRPRRVPDDTIRHSGRPARTYGHTAVGPLGDRDLYLGCASGAPEDGGYHGVRDPRDHLGARSAAAGGRRFAVAALIVARGPDRRLPQRGDDALGAQ